MINPTNETGYNPTNTSMLSSVYRASREVTAQLVEQRTENPRGTGSIPVLGMNPYEYYFVVFVRVFYVL